MAVTLTRVLIERKYLIHYQVLEVYAQHREREIRKEKCKQTESRKANESRTAAGTSCRINSTILLSQFHSNSPKTLCLSRWRLYFERHSTFLINWQQPERITCPPTQAQRHLWKGWLNSPGIDTNIWRKILLSCDVYWSYNMFACSHEGIQNKSRSAFIEIFTWNLAVASEEQECVVIWLCHRSHNNREHRWKQKLSTHFLQAINSTQKNSSTDGC